MTNLYSATLSTGSHPCSQKTIWPGLVPLLHCPVNIKKRPLYMLRINPTESQFSNEESNFLAVKRLNSHNKIRVHHYEIIKALSHQSGQGKDFYWNSTILNSTKDFYVEYVLLPTVPQKIVNSSPKDSEKIKNLHLA